MKGGRVVWAIGIAASLLGAGLWYSRPHVYRYRMTVEVETPAGVRTGSAVREIRWSRMPALTPESHPILAKQAGEAVPVELPSGRTLFALLDKEAHETILSGFFTIVGEKGAMGALLKEADRTRQLYGVPEPGLLQKYLLPYPRLVTFEDPSDPTSVIAVDPTDLGKTLGPSYALSRITLQITDDPVTNRIASYLPWLGSYPEPRLNPRHGPRDWSLAATLTHGDFRIGVKA